MKLDEVRLQIEDKPDPEQPPVHGADLEAAAKILNDLKIEDPTGQLLRYIAEFLARCRVEHTGRAADFEQRFRMRLEAAIEDPANPKEFQDLLKLGMAYFDLDALKVADLVSVSRPTVLRWCAGALCPAPTMRRPLYRVLLKLLPDTP